MAVEGAAQARSIRLETLEGNDLDDLEEACAKMVRRPVQAITLPFRSPLLFANRVRIIDFAAEHRLPAIYGDAPVVKEGGLMFYSSSVEDQERRAAALVVKVLSGVKPADIPVEQPTTYKLFINLKTAKNLRLTIPDEILSLADRMIQ